MEALKIALDTFSTRADSRSTASARRSTIRSSKSSISKGPSRSSAARPARVLHERFGDIRLIGLDRDTDALRIAGERLARFGERLCEVFAQPGAHLARLGGEEFCVIMPDTRLEDAQRIAERIRLAVSAEQTPLPERMTISMGVYTTHDGSVTAEECVQRADEAMYEAKNSGRNRVVIWRRQGR